MDRTATAVGVGPELGERPDQARCPVAHDEERAPQTPGDEAPAQVEPVLGPLALPEADVEEHPRAVGREAPGDEDALPGTLGSDRQVDGVHEERQETDLAEAPGPEGPVPVAQLATDPAHRRPADRAQTGLPRQALDVAVTEAPDVGADDERLERPCPDDRSRVGDDRAHEAGERVAPLGHRDRDLALGGLDPAGPVAIPGARCLGCPLVAARPRKAAISSSTARWRMSWAPRRPSWLSSSGPLTPSSCARPTVLHTTARQPPFAVSLTTASAIASTLPSRNASPRVRAFS